MGQVGFHGWQMHRERGASSRRAVDRQPAAMAVENVLDQRQTEAGTALIAALADADPIEALSEPRQMLWRNTRPVIAHADLYLGLAFLCTYRREFDIDALTGGAVLNGVLDQVLEQPNQFVAIAQHRLRARCLDVDRDPAVARERLQAVSHLPDNRHDIDRGIGAAVGVEFNLR